MTAKEQLNAIRIEDKAIQDAQDRCGNWFDAATRGTGSMEAERVSGTGERSRVEAAVCSMIDYEREQQLTARIDALVDMRQSAERIISQIEPPRFRQVLTLRYLQTESWTWGWRRIASVMGLPLTTVYELHGWALQAYSKAEVADAVVIDGDVISIKSKWPFGTAITDGITAMKMPERKL